MRNASLEDSQLLAESKILQRDLFVAAKDQKDHPKKREDCVQHKGESVSVSSLKINRLRDRWDFGEPQPDHAENRRDEMDNENNQITHEQWYTAARKPPNSDLIWNSPGTARSKQLSCGIVSSFTSSSLTSDGYRGRPL
jgi:hypothetical protein